MIKLKLIFFFLVICIQNSNAQVKYPILTEIVTDNAALFRESETLELRQKLTAYETETSHQIVVLTINNLGNNTVEGYAYHVFNTNKLGQKNKDNGLLILISKTDRKFRIEVGKGLEPIITDAFASRIISKIMRPKFKEGLFYEGVDLGTSEIIKLINDPKYRDEFAQVIEDEGKIPLWVKILLGLFLTLFLGIFIGVGSALFYSGFKRLINLFRGLITGKVSVLMFPVYMIHSVLAIVFSLPFIIMPLFFAGLMIGSQMDSDFQFDPFKYVDNASFINITNAVAFAALIFVVIPLGIAYFTRSKTRYQPIKFSLLKSNKAFISKNFSSSGTSSSRSYSSSSSSSFSGGGGSSGGGGASGSW
ncbi:TPM domain-containing protein [Algibacter pectinivorans]|uniref:TPM domain-containing protein n=1 Tax=Algibacter pectinivorans TaxID=870482 RepID=A0A1I1NFG0_9FLAO|nr:TPM domain-containing protein [Algibacter pectinivorans]SFC96444.1 uncharacterized protein SAMN04487987_102269 [Algibacter pectinivorans]